MKSIRKSCQIGMILAGAITISSSALAQIPDQPNQDATRGPARIPVNYTEADAGKYTLPDVLKTFDGRQVTDAKMWNEVRRPELLKFFASEYYGRIPETAPKVTWEVVSTDRNALNGTAIMKVLAGHMGGPDAPVMNATLYTPVNATGPVPVLTAFGGGPGPGGARGPATGPATAPGGLEALPGRGPATAPGGAGTRAGGRAGGAAVFRAGPADLIARGYAYATISNTSIETDREGQPASPPNVNIVRKLALKPGQEYPADDEWGTIATWAWGISRLVDYYETDPAVDAKRVAIWGGSRLGKTVTWAGASDPRIALVIASCGGEGGAAIARRNYGETIAHLVAPSRYPYQFALNYKKYAADPNTSPVDTHCLVALMAPRPILLSTSSQDGWSDPYGEFCAAVAATPVFTLLGKQGLDNDKFPGTGPTAGTGVIVGHELSYTMVNGGHVTPDWNAWLKFMDTYLKPGT